MLTEVEARAKGATMLRKLKGTGWTIEIFENCGWHATAHNRHISVHESHGQYYALFSLDPTRTGCGDIFWPKSGLFNNPQKAVESFMDGARLFLNTVRCAVEYVEKRTCRRTTCS
jgi:hypothetical protein